MNREGAWEGRATPALAAALAQPTAGAPALRQVRVSPAESWAIGTRGLRRPDAGPQREALAALRDGTVLLPTEH